ncbi:MAG: M23 family metallopeptidase [Silicimonas sp.]|nr:M23 family metallopeptidase [Silicimonas sp.]
MNLAVRWVCAIAASLAIVACDSEERGRAHWYRADATNPIDVEMPAGALYISQQFFQPSAGPPHAGIDIIGPRGTPILAAAPGKVVASHYEPLYGNRIRLDHGVDGQGRRVFTQYYHMDKRFRRVGDRVRRGQVIGHLGSTGVLGLANHLHFEVHRGVSEAEAVPRDPHLFWVNGVGKVTCFRAGLGGVAQGLTFPTPCS